MKTSNPISLFTLILLISFASVNAVLFTPALPNIANFFSITHDTAQQTITWFLVGYTLGQLVYGPIANRFGRRPALYAGVALQIISSIICIVSGAFHFFSMLVIGRFLLALGSGVGLKMTFTLVNEIYEPHIASQKIAYSMLAFAITPGLAVALGGLLNEHLGWISCFYACAIYGTFMLFLVMRIPETLKTCDLDALRPSHLIQSYADQFKNIKLVAGGMMMGCGTSFVYIFAAVAPFLAIDLHGMSSEGYGFANLLPPIGLMAGSLTSAQLVRSFPMKTVIKLGILITSLGAVFMITAVAFDLNPISSLFLPMIIIYFGLSLILANASTVAMSHVTDKAHGSAVMSFINMGLSTLLVLGLAFFTINSFLIPAIYLGLCGLLILIYRLVMVNE